MTRHDLILKNLKTAQQKQLKFIRAFICKKSNVILCLNWSQCGGGSFLPKHYSQSKSIILSTLAPAQITERNAATCFPCDGGGGGARPHFHPPFSRPSFKQSRTALIDHGEGGGADTHRFQSNPETPNLPICCSLSFKKKGNFQKKI